MSDIDRVVEQVRTRAAAWKGANRLPSELTQSIDERARRFAVRSSQRAVGRLRGVIRQVERLSFIDHRVSTASEHSFLVPVKRGVRKVADWYVGAVVAQVRDLAGANVQALRVVADAIEALEGRIDELEASVAQLRSDIERGSG
jgi:prefoldin subunit 5